MRRVWEFWVNVVAAFAPFFDREIFENGISWLIDWLVVFCWNQLCYFLCFLFLLLPSTMFFPTNILSSSKCKQHSPKKFHTLLTQTLICYDLLIINTSTQEVVMFLNNTLQLCFTTNPFISQPHSHVPPKPKPTSSRT